MDAARLRRSKDIEPLRAVQPALSDRHLVARASANDLGVARIAISTPRSLGGAVRRNRARRRLREAARVELRAYPGPRGADILLTARKEAISGAPAAVRASVRAALAVALRR